MQITRQRPRRRAALAAAALLAGGLTAVLPGSPAAAVTTGNGALVYSPASGSSFDPAGTTYAKEIAFKNNGQYNGQLLVTFDQLVYVNGVQV